MYREACFAPPPSLSVYLSIHPTIHLSIYVSEVVLACSDLSASWRYNAWAREVLAESLAGRPPCLAVVRVAESDFSAAPALTDGTWQSEAAQ